MSSKKLAGVLAYLACNASRPSPREKLSALLWGSYFDAQARQNLRQALFRLRKVLGQDAMGGDGEVVSLDPAAVFCDVAQFEALIREGSRDALTAAVDLYRGRLIEDLTVGEEGWNEWLSGERKRLDELALGAMVRLGDQELAVGRAEHALKAGQRAIALNDMREDAHRLVVRALAATGRKAEGLKHYQNLVEFLKRELNTEPDAATRSLAAELRNIQPPGGSPAVNEIAPTQPEPVLPFVDMGAGPEHPAGTESNVARGDEASSATMVRSGPERRPLTVLVCNIIGSVPLSTRLDPEDMHDLIVLFHKAVADTASRFGGFVAQYLSDGVRVYFGYPAAHEHDAEQAVRAGAAIIEIVETLRTSSAVTLRASVGIATGLVVVDERPDKRQQVAIGEAPNIAAKLQALASPGEVVIAASTHRLVGRMFDCRALAAIEVEGLSQPVEAWKVRGEAAGVSRFEARRPRGQSKLVGRRDEIELLLRRWDQAKAGEGKVVVLSGEPGIGKSRIAESLLLELGDQPHARLRYFCSPHHTQSPLYPLITQLEQAAGFEPGSSPEAKLDKLEVMLRPTSKDLRRDVALVAELIGTPADERYPALDVSPQQKREMTLAALLDLVAGAAALRPLLIVFEDAHWIDPTSQDLLDRMVARIAGLPVLLVVTVRPELKPSWVGEPQVSMLALSRLGRRDSSAIIAGVARDKALPDVVVEQVLSHTDGVPLFIEELTSNLIESGALRETAAGYELDGQLPKLAIPTTLQASLLARLDRFASVKDVAQIGAAIGREFSHELIAAVSPLAPNDLDAALERLTEAGLIARRGTPPDATYTFKHALVQDAAYDTMIRSRRRPLHASIAKGLVERFPALAESLPEVVAHHFTEAGLTVEAIACWLKAGRLASARSANREAVSSLERARSLIDTLPESRSRLEQGYDVRLELRPVLLELGRGAQMLECLREAEALADQLNDDRRRGGVYGFMTVVYSLAGELDQALAAGSRALEVAGRLDDLRLRIVATSLLLQVHHAMGHYDEVIELATGNLAALPGEWVHETLGLGGPPSVWDRGCLVQSLAERGRFAEAAGHEAEMLRLAELSQHSFTISMANFASSVLHIIKGDWAEAHSRIERWVALARTGKFSFHLSWGVAASCWPTAQLGEQNEASNRITEAEALLERLAAGRIRASLVWFYCSVARACLLLGRLDEARRLGYRALDFCTLQPGFEAHARHLLGDVATHPDRIDAEQGEAHYHYALALAERLDMAPMIAHCHFGLAKIRLRSGAHEQAQVHVATAATMYRGMGMTHWLVQAEALLARP
ncbi:BTAD domain-containing putative transcriptional regulator [Bradyrhizobium sp. NAS80.1]|uniref:BTAD domain-containing putative transcriptional regulator n=1 Tax=Bradyrhizobium sp. NAS80.1 TaxID=1680159 RepID=UPI001FD9AD8F|nr:BTAD domain-containing putative transcriptional regulator [Bradyrhizobium sp. NAS80.1]